MASNPPFQMEDQTDEDFFDKLVEDDDDVGPVKPVVIKSGNDEGNDSDDANAFANLSISDVDAGAFDNSVVGESGVEVKEELGVVKSDVGLDGGGDDDGKEGNLLMGSSSVECDSKTELGKEEIGIGSEFTAVAPVGKSNEVASSGLMDIAAVGESNEVALSGIKEKDWNCFSADDANGVGGFGSYSDFFSELGDQSSDFPVISHDNLNSQVSPVIEAHNVVLNSSVDYSQYQGVQGYDTSFDNHTGKQGDGLNTSVNYVQYQEGGGAYDASSNLHNNGQDLSSSQNWEDLYPGWKYDHITGQWYQIEDYNATTTSQQTSEANTAVDWAAASDGKTEISYLQQAAQSVAGTLAETGTTESVSSWNQVSQGNNGYLEHMVFDPQYPDWYYDTIAQEWRSLATYNSSVQSSVHGLQNGHTSTSTSSFNDDNSLYSEYSQAGNHVSQGVGSQAVNGSWSGSHGVSQAGNYDGSHGVGSQAVNGSWSGSHGVNQAGNYGGSQGVGSQAVNGSWSGSHGVNQAGNYGGSQGVGSQAVNGSWSGSHGVNHQQGFDMYATEASTKIGNNTASSGNQQVHHSYGNQQVNTSSSFGSVALNNKGSFEPKAFVPHRDIAHQFNYQDTEFDNGTFAPKTFVPHGDIAQQFNYPNTKFDEQKQFSNVFAENQNSHSYSQQPIQGGLQYSYAPHAGRSSAGRPSHALVTFGFGGKLIIMKDPSALTASYGSQDSVQGSISVLNLMEAVTGSNNSLTIGNATGDYFRALSQQSFPGPLVGGSVGSKELYKWLDERIARCESPDMDYKKGERLRLLLSLLKIACQHYGKLRSPFGTDTILKENDAPESAVAKLFASAKVNGTEFTQYGMPSHCLQNFPSEEQMKAIASEMQNLLVSGKKMEALQRAQEGQLWGPALVLASQLGEQFYVDTVRQMALRQLVAGSPLRTLCLLIAGRPNDVFPTEETSISGHPGAVGMPQQSEQAGSNDMLEDWEENLAVITANRTKGDELVMMHLGDCLWKEKREITAAHICYLIAEVNFSSYSDATRLCLIGADHWTRPRTYASPEAIQRTELYEYSKLLGNSQFVLHSFQPYKLIYAHMLAEVGKVSDSLKYCQAVLKSLKTGRAPEVETWKQLVLALEERIRTHQQGGYAANLAPAKLVGKLLNFFDSTAHRVVGGLPPPAPTSSQATVHGSEQHYQHMAPRVSTSQSTMAMSSLVPSASLEPISEWTADNNRMAAKPNRSVSEPDIGRSPRQESPSPDAQGKVQVSGGASRFSRFGFGSQLLQKTVGLVLRSGKQAKLGEKNKFYYDEKLKRWVEEGAEVPAEEAALPPPPPTTAAFQNGSADYNLKSALKTEGLTPNEFSSTRTSSPELSPGMPPIPPSSNQFSARSRLGVRSRYVDTFNQNGGSSANLFQSPSVQSVKPALPANAKFFIPAPVPSSSEQNMEAIAESNLEDSAANENPSTSSTNDWSYHPPKHAQTMTMQRFPSAGNISKQGQTDGNESHFSHSRRTASWSGSFNDSFSPPKMGEIKPSGAALGMPPSAFMPDPSSLMQGPTRSGSFGEDLQEVEL
ncbi:putative COPII coat assembly protein, Sec16 [Medicago truncatula]|uniref:Protein transport protein sec16 n=1 Tax=Medicago truncatula TaxID=3880 RepID=A0A396HMN2_MEDTR|nr:protein transport protein SEC16A homolog [Medicago truncatula]XP_039690169.1 protein transport protein SEC16A homolog [Medicago truncatula]RHN53751.1 putative COPII coat assembly protein, Sec16 [Medicago truncatula]